MPNCTQSFFLYNTGHVAGFLSPYSYGRGEQYNMSHKNGFATHCYIDTTILPQTE